ncbi:hypothetical protein J7426_14335 [Tropicibacter sp. R16_0]|uniref:head-tail joining protein n=1 Tax=Tropicibacter sp. R16_0 TaxID=2821102 RepID=UPI001ADD02F9|nr:hypothetical protein [Tropicibacter sp. R16_0]MBO9451448.1 hypothetical protein [Tropicibacter sp. R16_0]
MSFAAQQGIDAVFDTLGVEARLDPDGVDRGVMLLPSQGDEEARFSSVDIIDASGVFEVRKADWAGFSDGAIVMVGSERRKVQSHRVLDRRRLKVVLNTVLVD